MRIGKGMLVAEAMRSTEDHYIADCQTRLGLDLLSGAWTGVVLWALGKGPRRPGELRDEIGGISQKVLTETLRKLESNGLVVRHRYAEAPPRVEYELTGPGRGLLEPLNALGRWTVRYADEVLEAQEAQETQKAQEREAQPLSGR
ncbi:winged helix-turn-helix transcriptional regulator [Spirillospora sp. NPDC048911]|uniref:winged helix-turn-helix transcriptional regulator n=1 Tax=Spirillospora sp. NPDC048911 TaxID=3364527 RepID=UPI0037147253